jgi:hypothetical protein
MTLTGIEVWIVRSFAATLIVVLPSVTSSTSIGPPDGRTQSYLLRVLADSSYASTFQRVGDDV